MASGKSSQSKTIRRSWNTNEEVALLDVLEDLVVQGRKCDNGTFKPGSLALMEKALEKLCPNSGLQANPHIDSKLRMWKKYYGVICDMINTSGFAWNDVKKCIEVDSDEAWESYVKSHKDAKEWRGKSFPYFERLANILGKDRATGKEAQGPVDMAQAVDEEEEVRLDVDDHESSPMSPMSIHNTSSATSTRSRKRNRECDGGEDAIMKSFEKMITMSNEQMSLTFERMTDKLVKGNENRTDISNELGGMGLSTMDHINVLHAILDKPQNVSTFMSLQNKELKEAYVYHILGQLKGN